MGKKLPKMSSMKSNSYSSKPNESSNSSSWISGLVGHLHTGTIFRCDVQDKSFYCTLSKIFSSLIMILVLLFILYLIFLVASSFRKRR